MDREREFSVNGPIAKLEMQHAQELVRQKKPEPVDLESAQKLVDRRL